MAGSLAEVVAHVAEYLPAQGPIGVFIHHNPLHAFEQRPFEQAVVEAGALLGTEPFLSEARYRAALAAGRIDADDLAAVLAAEPAEDAAAPIAGVTTRGTLRARLLAEGLPDPPHGQVEWVVHEAGLAEQPLWPACLRAAERAGTVTEAAPPPRRHRDLWLAATGVDTDEWIHPFLVRVSAAYLDQGVAYWPGPGRTGGLLRWTARLYGAARPRHPAPWMRHLGRLLFDEVGRQASDLEVIARSLEALGVAEAEREGFLLASVLALRGWAGMMRQLEVRPDRAPVHDPGATLAGFLATRLLCDRAAAAALAEEHPDLPPPAALWAGRAASAWRAVPPARLAWSLLHAAQRLGLDAAGVDGLSGAAARELLEELRRFDGLTRRRLLHLAYERHQHRRWLDALALHEGGAPAGPPALQAVFCLDERSESLRRHLEEVLPAAETLGTAGFFGVAMYYRGAAEAHARPSCPIVVRPGHLVEEEAPVRAARRHVGRLVRGFSVGSKTLVRGTVIAALAGALAAVPLVLKVLFPRLAAWVRARSRRLVTAPGEGRLALVAKPEAPAEAARRGFSPEEMADIVESLLRTLGVAGRLAPLVLVVGHRSTSRNNPHASAYDCGACGGGPGGPNARAFAQMANRPEVRALLAARGLEIPAETWFVAAEQDTCADAIRWFDLDALPPAAAAALGEARRAVDEARRRDAHERCRRFGDVPLSITPADALAHVEARSADLAQPRPEYGHATNALCVVGRRERTRGLYLDRRAFLVSYDPSRDDAEATLLERLLAAAVPVVAGINLEYYFGRVDPTGYGCGTKLPHNISALLGVMDGHASDLRTGLTWQMVELHEPMRLLLVVEARPEVLARVVARQPYLARLVENRWIRLAALDPAGAGVQVWREGGFRPHRTGPAVLPSAPSSLAWYAGRREHLPPAAIRGAAR